jgi:hypothetical protein
MPTPLTTLLGTNNLRASALSAHLLEAAAAIHRLIPTRDERYLSLTAAIGAANGCHRAGTRALLSPASTTRRTTCGIVHQALQGKELLLTSGEHEARSAVSTGEGSVSVAHLDLLFLGSWPLSGLRPTGARTTPSALYIAEARCVRFQRETEPVPPLCIIHETL